VRAIVPPEAPEQAIVLLEDFYPLVLSEAQRLTAKAALHAATHSAAAAAPPA
jgi:hypothetical protein